MTERFPRQYLLRQLSRLSGLSRFPVASEGRMTQEDVNSIVNETLVVLNEACINEEHVEKTISEWLYDQEFFPIPAELRRKAWSIRSRYDPGFTVEEPKYPPAAPPAEMPDELQELWTKACANVDAQDEMWAAIKRELKVTDFAKVSWAQVYRAKQKLGYALSSEERKWLK